MSNDNCPIAAMAGIGTSIDRKFRIEASWTDPDSRTGYERDNINDYCLVRDIGLAFDQAILYLEHGYFVEVYDDALDTKLAGPFNPNDLYPNLTNFITAEQEAS